MQEPHDEHDPTGAALVWPILIFMGIAVWAWSHFLGVPWF